MRWHELFIRKYKKVIMSVCSSFVCKWVFQEQKCVTFVYLLVFVWVNSKWHKIEQNKTKQNSSTLSTIYLFEKNKFNSRIFHFIHNRWRATTTTINIEKKLFSHLIISLERKKMVENSIFWAKKKHLTFLRCKKSRHNIFFAKHSQKSYKLVSDEKKVALESWI